MCCCISTLPYKGYLALRCDIAFKERKERLSDIKNNQPDKMLDPKNIQGDIWPRLPEKAERFVFFRITNEQEFKKGLPMMADFLTTAYAASENRNDIYRKKADGTQGYHSFSFDQYVILGYWPGPAEKFNDDVFNGGQFKDMNTPSAGETAEDHQGLDPQQDWVPEFKPSGGGINGVLIVDGISQPIVKGFDDISKQSIGKGITPIDPGVIIIGNEGDKSMPEWAKDGSFMVFRIYQQLVPEFYHSLLKILIEYDTRGAPMELCPEENPNNGLSQDKDPEKNKVLVEMKLGQQGLDRLKTVHVPLCLSYHMRKTGPRDDYPNYTKHVIMRRGIPYGPECSADKRTRGYTEHDRGLLFVSYQSSIDNGFRTQQKLEVSARELTLLFGQVHPSRIRESTGDRINSKYQDPPQIQFPETVYGKTAPQIYDKTVDLARLCIPYGGEYFFSPLISALKSYLPSVLVDEYDFGLIYFDSS
ncbi:unnamed protein product [Penicillium nalgiovense]|nr:unnamed protein product [Penicillium nalgiovense]